MTTYLVVFLGKIHEITKLKLTKSNIFLRAAALMLNRELVFGTGTLITKNRVISGMKIIKSHQSFRKVSNCSFMPAWYHSLTPYVLVCYLH
jgi:hypothetical protein